MGYIGNTFTQNDNPITQILNAIGDWFRWIADISESIPIIGGYLKSGFIELANFFHELGNQFDSFFGLFDDVIQNVNLFQSGNFIFNTLYQSWSDIVQIKNNPSQWIMNNLNAINPYLLSLFQNPLDTILILLSYTYPAFYQWLTSGLNQVQLWFENSYTWLNWLNRNPNGFFTWFFQNNFYPLYLLYQNPYGTILSWIYQNNPEAYILLFQPSQFIDNFLQRNFPELKSFFANPEQFIYNKLVRFIELNFELFASVAKTIFVKVLEYLWEK